MPLAMLQAVVLATGTTAPPASRRAATLTPVSCSVRASAIAFPSDTTVTPYTVSVTCPAGFSYTLELMQTNGCGSMRRAYDGENAVEYRIVAPSGGVWCDGTNGTSVVRATGTGSEQIFSGSIVLGSSRRHAGTYRDQIQGALIGN